MMVILGLFYFYLCSVWTYVCVHAVPRKSEARDILVPELQAVVNHPRERWELNSDLPQKQ